MSAKELFETYRELLIEWKEYCLREQIQKKTISAPLLKEGKLGSTIVDLEEEVALLKSKLDNMIKFVCMLNNGSDMLYEITEIREKKAIGFDYSSMNKKVKFHTKKFVAPKKKIDYDDGPHVPTSRSTCIPSQKKQEEIILDVSPLWKIWPYKTLFL